MVSGGTKGIGRAIIDIFAENGFDIAVYSRNENDLSELKLEIEKKYGVSLQYMVVDGSQRDQVEAFAEMIQNLDSELEVLVNNAGTFVPGTILEEEEGALVKMIETNVYSAYYLTRILGPILKERKSGHIFNICSTASIMAYSNGGSYCISKHALLGFSRVLREELKEYNVRVTAVLPGATLTASWEGVDLPESRFMKATDVSEAVFSAYSLSPNTVLEELILRPQLGDL